MKQYIQKDGFYIENCKTWSVLEQIAREGTQKMNKIFRDGELVDNVAQRSMFSKDVNFLIHNI
jgi:hypothetical protein